MAASKATTPEAYLAELAPDRADEVRAIRVSSCGRKRIVVRIVGSEAQQREHADGEDHYAQNLVAGFARGCVEARRGCLNFWSCSSHLVVPYERAVAVGSS